MANPENITKLTKEQLSEYGRRGAAKSNAIRRQKKLMAEELKIIMSLPVKRSNKAAGIANKLISTDKAKALEDFSKQNTTVQTQIILKLVNMAMCGNLKAMQLIMELSGEMNQKTVDTSALDRLDGILGGLKAAAYKDEDEDVNGSNT